MSRRRQVQAILDETSREIAGLGMAELRALFIVLRQAEVELTVGLGEWLKEHGGDERFTSGQMRNALGSVREALQTIRNLQPYMAGQLETLRTVAATMATDHAIAQVRSFGMLYEQRLRPTNLRIAAVLEKGDRLLIRRHATSARRYAGAMERHIRRQLAVGVLKGESFDQMTTRLARLAPRRLFDAALEPAAAAARGLTQLPRAQASRLIRTESIHAYNVYHTESITDLAEDEPDIGKRWDASLDRRGCELCRRLDGQWRESGQKFEMNGLFFDHPPAHPHCRCTTVAWSKEWDHDSLASTGTEALYAPDPKPFTPRRDERAAAK